MVDDQAKAIEALKAENIVANSPIWRAIGMWFRNKRGEGFGVPGAATDIDLEIERLIDRTVSISRASQGSLPDGMVCVPIYDLGAESPNVIGPDERAAIRARASQGSREGMEDDVERVARALCALDGFDPDENVEHKRPYAESIMIFAWNGYEEEARAAISALSPPADQGSRVKLESDLADLVRHCRVHSAYRNCGYDQMTTAQKQLYDAIVSADPDDDAEPPATPQAPEDVRTDLATIEFEEARAIVRVAGAEVRAFTLANRNAKALDLAMKINRAALSRAHILATPVTVTMEECDRIGFDMKQNMGLSLADAVATALRRVLGDRIQISGEQS